MSHAHAISLTVRDSAAMLDATQGAERGAPYAAPPTPRPFLEEIVRPPRWLRIAFTDCRPDGSAIDPEVAAAVHETAALLERLGHVVEQASPTLSFDPGPANRAIIGVNTALTLRQRATELGRPIAADEIEFVTAALRGMGEETSGVDYLAAIATMHRLGADLAAFFARFDVLLAPMLCLPPLRLGELNTMSQDMAATLGLIGRYVPYPALFNMSGQPSMSVPLAWSKDGLPLGMMFSAAFGEDATLLRLAAQLEQARPWRNKKPPIAA